MRILIIDFAYQYMNRTAMLWKLAWRQLGDSVFFGPGHVSEEAWQGGLASFIRRNGSFDVIVCGELLVSSLSSEHDREVLAKAVERNYDNPFNVRTALDSCSRNFEEFLEADAIRVLSMLEFDTFNMHASHRKRLDDANVFIVGWGEDFVRPKESLKGLESETFSGQVNDRWYDFVKFNRRRIISSPGMVAENEFYWTTLANRKDRWAVQGSRYYAREEARRRLKKIGRPFVGRTLVNLISVINRIDPRILRWPSVRVAMNHLWEEGFRTSRYAFTCGSALRLPIRKYFEIPASGAVLAAQPCNGFSALGFQDGENAIITEPENIIEVDAMLCDDRDLAQKLASAGRELVWERHRVGARADQYAQALEAISTGCFHGTQWIEGKFTMLGKEHDSELNT